MGPVQGKRKLDPSAFLPIAFPMVNYILLFQQIPLQQTSSIMFDVDKLSSQMVRIQLVTKLPYGAFFPRRAAVAPS